LPRCSAPRFAFICSRLGARRPGRRPPILPALLLGSAMALAACASDNIPTLIAAPAPAAGAPAPGKPAQPTVAPGTPEPQTLIGKGKSDLVALLGNPALVRKERGVEVWQYAGGQCVMLFYLYDDATAGTPRVTYLEAMPQGLSGDVTAQLCLSEQILAAAGRPVS
jgi:hypothetical protein